MHREQLSYGTTQVVPLRPEFSKSSIDPADLLVFFPRTSEYLVFHDHHYTPTASTRAHSSFWDRPGYASQSRVCGQDMGIDLFNVQLEGQTHASLVTSLRIRLDRGAA
jgi:hypothetical protein